MGVQMVGRLVQQQHVRLGQQQAAQRHAAFFTTGQRPDLGVPRRQAQRVGGHFELALQRVRVVGGEQVFQLLLLLGQLVEIGAFFGVFGVDLVQALLRVENFGDAFFDRFAHGLFRIQLRLLRQIADLGAGVGACLTLEVGVHAGHDFQHGGLACAVDAEQADFGAREKGQRDVLDDLALRGNDLAHPVHGVDVLHGASEGVRSAGPQRLARWNRGCRSADDYTGSG
jgi:hypothetical protein